jgi:hypothetical protein
VQGGPQQFYYSLENSENAK